MTIATDRRDAMIQLLPKKLDDLTRAVEELTAAVVLAGGIGVGQMADAAEELRSALRDARAGR